MPYYYNTKKIKINNIEGVSQSIAYTTDGYLLPCCWCDAPSTKTDIVNAGLYDENLKLENNTSVENILTSTAWGKFINTIMHSPENAARCCREKCGVVDE
jgi:hypothetical protein